MFQSAFLLGGVLAGVCVASCVAQAQAQTLPSGVTMQIDKLFHEWNRTDSPGCALGVYQGGAIAYKHGYGMANLNDDVPIAPETVFHVASMSKQFTAAAIVLLAEQGKFSLDDDIHKYVPELKDFGSTITIRNLLHHTSGLRDQWTLLDLAGWRYSQDLITDDDILSLMTRQKDLNFKPGEQYGYSNTNYTLLGLIVKRVSGMSLREFTTKNIFGPLDMTHTHFRDDHEEIIKHDALGYERADKASPFRMNLTNFDTVGATSLHTTVEDLQLWDENFYHPRIGGPSFPQQMLERGKLNNGEQLDYALGLSVGQYRGLPIVSHSGSDAGYRSAMTRFPDQHFTVAVLCNSAETNPSDLALQVADIVLAQDFKTPKGESTSSLDKTTGITLTPDQMAGVIGVFWNRANDDVEKIQVKDGRLQWLDLSSQETHILKASGDGLFHVADASWGDRFSLHFFAAAAGQPRRFEQNFDGAKPDAFEAVTPFEPTATELAEYVGAYESDEIDPVYRIVLQNGALNLLRLKHKADLLRPTVRDAFVGDIGKIRFTRETNGRIIGFILNAGRVQNFRFSKEAK